VRCEAAESARTRAGNTPSAEMEEAVGQAIEEAEVAAAAARDEAAALRAEVAEVREAAAEAEAEAAAARSEALEARTRAAVLEEMASLRRGRAGTAAVEAAAAVAAGEAAAIATGKIEAARAQAATAMAEVVRLTEKLAAVADASADASDNGAPPSPVLSHQNDQGQSAADGGDRGRGDGEGGGRGEDEKVLCARLASILVTLRAAGAPDTAATARSDGDIWSWAFGASEDTAAAKARRATVDAVGTSGGGWDSGGGIAGTGSFGAGPSEDTAAAPPVHALLADLERWALDSGETWSQALMEQSRRVATDAIARARSAEEASLQRAAALEAAGERTTVGTSPAHARTPCGVRYSHSVRSLSRPAHARTRRSCRHSQTLKPDLVKHLDPEPWTLIPEPWILNPAPCTPTSEP